jgi:glutamate synthase (NADPH/NADH) small chain
LGDLPEWLKGMPEIGKTVVVIGGGDASVDCVRTARRLQVQHGYQDGSVVGYYRGTKSEMRARKENFTRSKEEGVQYEFLVAPIRFINDAQGHVRQIEIQRMKSRLTQPSENRVQSRVRTPIPGSNFIVPADIVVLTIGYGGDELIPYNVPALKMTKPGIFEIESEMTGIATLGSGYGASNDVRSIDMIGISIAVGRNAAQVMDHYLQSLP